MLSNFPIVGKPYRPIKIKSFNAYKGLQFGGGGELPTLSPRQWFQRDATESPQTKVARQNSADPNFAQRQSDDIWNTINAVGSFTPAWPLFAANQVGRSIDKGEYGQAGLEGAMIAAPYVIGKGIAAALPYVKRGTSALKNMFKGREKTLAPTAEKPFSSEINWGNWNNEIPQNKDLLDEYHAIEKSTKKSGSWMKNSDGTEFSGTPEQFVQEQSGNFKGAFSGGHNITYRGDRQHFPELDYNPIFTGDKKMALNYTNDNAGYWKPTHQEGDFSYIRDPNAGGLHELYYGKNRNTLHIDAKNRSFLDLNVPEINKKGLVGTDDVSAYINGRDMNAEIRNVYDASSHPGLVNIIGHNPGKYLKSARGNNGMFDMTNANIYRSLLPIIGVSALKNKTNKTK